MHLINSRCRTGEWTAKSFHRFRNYSLSDPPCYTVSHISEFRFRFIMCLCALKRLTHQVFLTKALQSQFHLDAERTDFSARHLPFSDPSIQGSVCSEKAFYSKNHIKHHIVSSAIPSKRQMVAAILEHRQEEFMLIIFIQKFSVPCQGLFSSQSPKLQSDLLKVLYKSEQKKITHVHEINSAVFNFF